MKHFTYNRTWNLLLHTIWGRPKMNVIHCASTYIAASCLIGNQRVVNCVSFHKELHEFLFWLINAKILGQTWVEFGRKDRQKRKLGSAKSSVWTNAERERERERERDWHMSGLRPEFVDPRLLAFISCSVLVFFCVEYSLIPFQLLINAF